MLDFVREYVLSFETVIIHWVTFTFLYVLWLVFLGYRRVKGLFIIPKHRREVEKIGLTLLQKIRFILNLILFVTFIVLSTTAIIAMAFH